MNIKYLELDEKRIEIVITLMNVCNFKCYYCNFGRDFNNSLKKDFNVTYFSDENFSKFIDILLYLKNNKKGYFIKIIFTGGEPLLHKNIFDYIDKIISLNLDKYLIQVYTNGFYLFNKKEKINNIKNKSNLIFVITYHYYEYKRYGGDNLIIKGVNLLEENNVDYKFKFLVSNIVSKDDFFIKFNNILNKSKIDKSKVYFQNVIDGNGETFLDEGLEKTFKEYFKNENFSKKENYIMNVKYENGETGKIFLDELYKNGNNSLKYWNCFYLGDNFFSLHIDFNGNISFGKCQTLKDKKIDFDDLGKYLLNGEKSIICSENKCFNGTDLMIKKSKSKKIGKFIELKEIFSKVFLKLKFNIKFIDIGIFEKNSIRFTFQEGNRILEIYVERKIINKDYMFVTKKDLGIYICFKTQKGLPINILEIDDNVNKDIKKVIIFTSLYEKFFLKIV